MLKNKAECSNVKVPYQVNSVCVLFELHYIKVIYGI